MSHTYIRLYFHLTFHTKSNTLIKKNDITAIHSYMSGVIKNMGLIPIAIGGVGDHIHAIIRLDKAIIDFATVVRELKTASNSWLKQRDKAYTKFSWRRGYGLFSISYDKLDLAVEYVRNQDKHHVAKTARDEYLDFLRKMKIEFDERFAYSDD
ncbi:MAG: transposase [Muribaculaceae bacterium]|nr:transposase [Muribaculaceae bacterium]MDE6610634.1 transposase [Muribaculaceae bacterium]